MSDNLEGAAQGIKYLGLSSGGSAIIVAAITQYGRYRIAKLKCEQKKAKYNQKLRERHSSLEKRLDEKMSEKKRKIT